MIVDFSVKNFRSLRDEYTLSLYVENKGTHLLNNVKWDEKANIGVLTTAGIYGANASGKTNVLLAFHALKYLIAASDNFKERDIIPCYEPFQLDDISNTFPIFFEIEFLTADQQRYRYKVGFTKEKIVYEYLAYFSSAKPALLFERKEKDTWETIKFGTYLKGGRKKIAFFDNNLYLSKAGTSADAPEIIRNAYNYLRLEMFYLGVQRWHDVPVTPLVDNQNLLEKVSALLAFSDSGIEKVEIKPREIDESALSFPSTMTESEKATIVEELRHRPVFMHKKTDDSSYVFFDKEYESAGTIKLFHLAPLIFDALESGGVLIVDELDNSMHPHVAELIVRLFNDPEVNRGNGQLIFTTHSMSLMDSSFFRRDQVWFTEKNNGETSLYSLDDFAKKQVRFDSPFPRWYAEGRFGAIPQIDYNKIAEKFRGDLSSNA